MTLMLEQISSLKAQLVLATLLFVVSWGSADIKGVEGHLTFDSDGNGTAEAVLSETGFGIGIVSPSANLHIAGNGIVSGQLNIGSESSSSNLELSGSLAMSFGEVSSFEILDDHSVYLASGNSSLSVDLPNPSNILGRELTIKSKDVGLSLYLGAQGGAKIDGSAQMVLNSGGNSPFSSASFVASSGNWYMIQSLGLVELKPPLLDSTVLPSANAAFSLRKLREGYTGDCLRVRRDLDDSEQDIGFKGLMLNVEGLKNFATNDGAHPSGCAFVSKWYDQSVDAQAEMKQTIIDNQPIIVENGSVVTDNDGYPVIHLQNDGSRNSYLVRDNGQEVIRRTNGDFTIYVALEFSTVHSGRVYERMYDTIGVTVSATLQPRANIRDTTGFIWGAISANTMSTNTQLNFIHSGNVDSGAGTIDQELFVNGNIESFFHGGSWSGNYSHNAAGWGIGARKDGSGVIDAKYKTFMIWLQPLSSEGRLELERAPR